VELYLQDVLDSDFVSRLDLSIADLNLAVIANLFGERAAFDNAGLLQELIKSHQKSRTSR
jgi:hypothetical protein